MKTSFAHYIQKFNKLKNNMKAIAFKHQNTNIAEHQEQYETLPAYMAQNPQGEVNCFIEVSEAEIEQIKNQGGFWFNMWCFNSGVTPVRFQTECPIIDWHPLNDLSPENLFKILINGTVLSHETTGKDAIAVLIESIRHDVITANLMNVQTREIHRQVVEDFKSFSRTMKNLAGQWYYANNMKS